MELIIYFAVIGFMLLKIPVIIGLFFWGAYLLAGPNYVVTRPARTDPPPRPVFHRFHTTPRESASYIDMPNNKEMKAEMKAALRQPRLFAPTIDHERYDPPKLLEH